MFPPKIESADGMSKVNPLEAELAVEKIEAATTDKEPVPKGTCRLTEGGGVYSEMG